MTKEVDKIIDILEDKVQCTSCQNYFNADHMFTYHFKKARKEYNEDIIKRLHGYLETTISVEYYCEQCDTGSPSFCDKFIKEEPDDEAQ
jgi:energy-converting hydrogenase A subunit M